jgi:hypothetical protein
VQTVARGDEMKMYKSKFGSMYIFQADVTHVHVVLEMPEEGEPTVHGVFANREHAEDKKRKLHTRHKRHGYVAVLKQRIKGI